MLARAQGLTRGFALSCTSTWSVAKMQGSETCNGSCRCQCLCRVLCWQAKQPLDRGDYSRSLTFNRLNAHLVMLFDRMEYLESATRYPLVNAWVSTHMRTHTRTHTRPDSAYHRFCLLDPWTSGTLDAVAEVVVVQEHPVEITAVAFYGDVFGRKPVQCFGREVQCYQLS